MSDHYWIFIPDDPFYVPSETMAEQIKILNFDKHEVVFKATDSVQFADCGNNLEQIKCPFCKENLENWWSNAMSAAYSPENGFADLNIITPCCNKPSALNKLYYNFPVGFCRTSLRIKLDIYSRSYNEMDIQARLQEITGISWLVIHQHI